MLVVAEVPEGNIPLLVTHDKRALAGMEGHAVDGALCFKGTVALETMGPSQGRRRDGREGAHRQEEGWRIEGGVRDSVEGLV